MSVLPPPPPSRGESSCWKIGGIACGVGCGLAVIALIVFMVTVGPTCKKLLNAGVKMAAQSQQCIPEMQEVWQAVEKYHTDKGKYPDTLDALVPKYLPSKTKLHFSEEPAGSEFTYIKPGKDSGPNDVVLRYQLYMEAPNNQRVAYPVEIMKNGQPTASTGRYRGRGQFSGTGGD